MSSGNQLDEHAFTASPWIVCQLGGRERYAVPRALERMGLLKALITDLWFKPTSPFTHPVWGTKHIARWHSELAHARVFSSNAQSLLFESGALLFGDSDWKRMIARNRNFQLRALKHLQSLKWVEDHEQETTLFCYSYSARDLFRYAKSRGWRTVLGQIDLGPSEDSLEKTLLSQHPEWCCSTLQSPPADYWEEWREECALADQIMVNSEWARHSMLAEGIDEKRLTVVPLAYEEESHSLCRQMAGNASSFLSSQLHDCDTRNPLSILFLGQIVARKGIYDLVDAARLLVEFPVIINVVGPYRSLPENLPPNICFHGKASFREISSWYERSDVFVLPTHSDGFAITQLEAMAHGLPVISTKCCGSVVQEGWNGFLIPPGDPKSLAALLKRLTKERSLLLQMREHAKATLDRFSLNRLAQNLNALKISNSGIPSGAGR